MRGKDEGKRRGEKMKTEQDSRIEQLHITNQMYIDMITKENERKGVIMIDCWQKENKKMMTFKNKKNRYRDYD